MATNLTTISVQLQANAKDFKNKIDGSRKKLSQFKKTTDKVSSGQKNFQKELRNVAGSIAAVQGPLGPVAGRLNSIDQTLDELRESIMRIKFKEEGRYNDLLRLNESTYKTLNNEMETLVADIKKKSIAKKCIPRIEILIGEKHSRKKVYSECFYK